MKSIKTPWENAPDDISQYAGFVYRITNTITGQEYIGKKFFWEIRHKKIAGKKNRRKYIKESNWKSYRSSSDDVKKDIDELGIDNFRFTIVECFKHRQQVNYYETHLQFAENVLYAENESGQYQYYNKNILRRFFR